MNARRTVAGSLVAGLLAGLPAAALAADVSTVVFDDGSQLSVWRHEPVTRPRSRRLVDTRTGVLRYEHVEANGLARHVGIVDDVAEGQVTLARDPITDEAYLAHVTDVARGGSEIVLRSWLGQDFSEPWAVAPPSGEASEPRLVFGEGGDALVAWRLGGDEPTVRVMHVDLSPAGVEYVRSYADLSRAMDFLAPVAGDVGLSGLVATVAMDSLSGIGHVVLSDTETNSVAVVAMRLDALDDWWGGGALPVPVTLSPDPPMPLSTEGDLPSEETGALSWVIHPERAEALGSEVYYWLESEREIRAVAFRDGKAGELVSVLVDSANDPVLLAVLQATWTQLERGTPVGGGLVARPTGPRVRSRFLP